MTIQRYQADDYIDIYGQPDINTILNQLPEPPKGGILLINIKDSYNSTSRVEHRRFSRRPQSSESPFTPVLFCAFLLALASILITSTGNN